MFNEALFQDFPTFGAWYTNVYEPSLARQSGRPSECMSSPIVISDESHWQESEREDTKYEDTKYEDPEYEDPDYYLIETQPDVPEYYAPPAAASRQPDGPDAPWVRAVSALDLETL